MNPNAPSCRTLAFTLVEMLVVIAIIGILAAILLPVLNKSEARARRVFCIHSEKQIGLAFHAFSNDHSGKFPMAISTNDGGSLEYVQSGLNSSQEFYTAFRNFQPLSNELVLPQTLVCPADTARTATNNFASLQNENLSYSVGVQSTFDKPYSMLAADRSLEPGSYPELNPTIIEFPTWNNKAGWTRELHQYRGNVLFADGHVEEWNNSTVLTVDSNILFLPSVLREILPTASGGPGSSGSGPSSPGPGGTGPSAPSYPPNQPAPEQSLSSPAGKPGMQSSPSFQDSSSPAVKPAPFNPFGDRINQTETLFQTQVLVTVKTDVSGQATNAVVSIGDTNSAMSPFDSHMTMVMRNSLLWVYILICILVLLYLLNKVRKKFVEYRNEQDREI